MISMRTALILLGHALQVGTTIVLLRSFPDPLNPWPVLAFIAGSLVLYGRPLLPHVDAFKQQCFFEFYTFFCYCAPFLLWCGLELVRLVGLAAEGHLEECFDRAFIGIACQALFLLSILVDLVSVMSRVRAALLDSTMTPGERRQPETFSA